MSSLEKFRTAGHSAQGSLETTLPKETFLPIQRVIDNKLKGFDKTIGYLFRDIEYKEGVIGDIILTHEWIKHSDTRIITNTDSGWQQYENNAIQNPFGWFVPSGLLAIELIYRSQNDKGPLAEKIQQTWKTILAASEPYLTTSTIITRNNTSVISHNWTEKAQIAKTPDYCEISDTNTNDLTVNQYLFALFGKRYADTAQIFGQYGTSVELATGKAGKYILLLGSSGIFDINTEGNRHNIRPARGVAPASNILSNPRYEVRDE